jgi:hypothetical protein
MVRDLLQLNTFYKRVLIGALGLFVVLCAMYGIFLKTTVGSVVERRSLEGKRAELAAHVSVLEAEYIREGNRITRARATELGFVAITPTKFVSRDHQTFSLNQ